MSAIETRLPVLQNIGIAAPCSASWDEMEGDDRRRLCGQCSLHVYNIAELTEEQAVRLLTESEGRVCGRLYRRADGTIITRNCPVGLRLVRKKLAGLVGRVAAAVVLAGGVFGLFKTLASMHEGNGVTRLEPFATVQRWLDPINSAPVMMGEIYIPPAAGVTGGPGATPWCE